MNKNTVIPVVMIMTATKAIAAIDDKVVIDRKNSNDFLVDEEIMNKIERLSSNREVEKTLSELAFKLAEVLSDSDETIRQKYLSGDLYMLAYNSDSTNVGGPPSVACYGNCYQNCHSACHGSRGWR